MWLCEAKEGSGAEQVLKNTIFWMKIIYMEKEDCQ